MKNFLIESESDKVAASLIDIFFSLPINKKADLVAAALTISKAAIEDGHEISDRVDMSFLYRVLMELV